MSKPARMCGWPETLTEAPAQRLDLLAERLPRALQGRLQLEQAEKLKSDVRGFVMEGNLPLQLVLGDRQDVVAAIRRELHFFTLYRVLERSAPPPPPEALIS